VRPFNSPVTCGLLRSSLLKSRSEANNVAAAEAVPSMNRPKINDRQAHVQS
jgi:hypothetical protein